MLTVLPISLPQIGTWFSNNTLAMNSTSLDLNASETLANKSLIVTTILVTNELLNIQYVVQLPLNMVCLCFSSVQHAQTNCLIILLLVWQENPYVMRKSNYQDLHGNDQYEGFCVDMLRELADILKFSFKIKLVDDGLYGAPEPNGSWTGMVGELINRVSRKWCWLNWLFWNMFYYTRNFLYSDWKKWMFMTIPFIWKLLK